MESTASSDDASGDGGATGTPGYDRVESAVDRIARLATKLLSARIAAVSSIATGRLKIEAAVGVSAAALGRDLPLHDETLSHDSVLCILDASRDPRIAKHPLIVGPPCFRFYAAAPLRAADGRALGALTVMDPAPRDSFSDDDADTLRDLAAMVAAHVDAQQAISHTTPMAGLANRLRLLHDVGSFIENHPPDTPDLTVAVIETATSNEYSEVVRAFGPACADAFERESSRIIRQLVPRWARLYHLSVGRFACVFIEDTAVRLEDLFVKLHDAIRVPTECDGVPIAGNAAFGVATYPADAGDARELFRAAIAAVTDARQRGVRWSHYDAERDRKSSVRPS